MNSFYQKIGDFDPESSEPMGNKAVNLDLLVKQGYMVPNGIALTSHLYKQYLEDTGLGTWLSLQLAKKPLATMRWEEIWDLSITIRHKFKKTPIPDSMLASLLELIEPFANKRVVIRSSSLNEDSKAFSFAGVHDSIVGVQGMNSILEAIKEVWSSLWSDRALVYFSKFDLDFQDFSMAIILQELIIGEYSGVLFTEDFQNANQAVIETVKGLNEDLVSGKQTPERLILDKRTNQIISHIKPTDQEDLNLSEGSLQELINIGLRLEKEWQTPLDLEWTRSQGSLYILQIRPITKDKSEKQYDYQELFILGERITLEFLPQIQSVAQELSKLNLAGLDEQALELELLRRKNLKEEWEQKYLEYFIPFSQGVRLFGQVYNDVVMPESPFEFVDLLTKQDLLSVKRNKDLARMAAVYQKESKLSLSDLNLFLETYGQTSFFEEELFSDPKQVKTMVEKYSSLVGITKTEKSTQNLETIYLNSMKALGRDDGDKLLQLARLSYRLRDDDNLIVSKIYGEYYRAQKEWNRRKGLIAEVNSNNTDETSYFKIKKRQMTGASASPGLAKGLARVVRTKEDLFETREGEVLVCDSIDPNFTFIIPLVSAIVERRGGMLVHGAIIAREYGIPCITGVDNAAEVIETGDLVTVDAYSGIVTINT
jgi:phosphoenolpyruvate synthase/pyruvate phosphate dikinase